MTHIEEGKKLTRRRLLGGLALLVVAQPAWAILGVWRRTARRTAVVAGAATATAAAGANAAATQQAEAAANASAAAAKQAEASASQAAAATATKTPEQQLQELQTLYDQKLITEAEYNAQKQKILDAISR